MCFDKFIGDQTGITPDNRFGGVCKRYSCATNQRIVSNFDAFPAVITVHGIITPCNRSDPPGCSCKMLFQCHDKSGTAFRITVTTVGECMDKHVREPEIMGHRTECVKVIL